jgi:NhaA family Na+:H+ antiporter
MISAIAALALANSPLAEAYHHLWEYNIALNFGGHVIDKSVHHWINDGLMSMFFFVVGLELKREIIAGELSSFRKALLPLAAAVGGMVVPALIFLVFNANTPGENGWGIPMATDIAFALGILTFFGKRVPMSLKVFLTALAIADDLGAVLVIAFFYTSEISFVNLGAGVIFIFVLLAGNHLGVRNTLFYSIIGIGGVWIAFLMSGVHATIAGVLAAATIPARTKIDERDFLHRLEILTRRFRDIPPNNVNLLEPEQYNVLEKIHRLTLQATTPLQHLEHMLHPFVAFIIMPLFAFSNSGIELSTEFFNRTFFQGVSMGIVSGLLLGKFTGVVGTTWLLHRFRVASLPRDMTWAHVAVAGVLAAIGFTMSLFVTNLAFVDQALINEAKVGIFVASTIAGTTGYFLLKMILRKQDQSSTLGTRKN